MRKKALSALLALGMIVSLFPGQALAEAPPQAEEALFEETQEEEALFEEARDDAELSEEAAFEESQDAELSEETQDDAELSEEAQDDAELSEEAQDDAELFEEPQDDEALSEEPRDDAELFAAGEPVSLRVETPPDGMSVEKDATLDRDGLKVYAVYESGEEEVTDYALSALDTSQLGEKEVAVMYGGLTERFSVTVADRDYLAGIWILYPKPKRNYTQGEPLDITGLRIRAQYHLGSWEDIDGSQCAVTGYNPNQLGIQTITVSYKGKYSEYLVKVLPNPNPAPVPDQPEPGNVVIPNLPAPRINVETMKGGKKVTFTRETSEDGQFYLTYPGERAKIYYTLDGSAPAVGAEGTFEYDETKPLEIKESAIVKAVVIFGNETSSVVSGRISVPQVEAPIPANPNHWLGPNGEAAQLASGTLVSLLCDTAGASIYYWFERQADASAENSRYGSSVYVDDTYADGAGEVTLYAYAAKDGYKNSDLIALSYRLPKTEPPPAETVYISAGTVRSRAGDAVSTPLSITTEESSYVTSFTITIRYDQQNFQFDSISPAETGGPNSAQVIPAGELFAAPDPRQGTVRIMYNGEAVSGGEMCELNFRALDSAEDQPYLLSVDADSARVSTNSGRPVEQKTEDGKIILEGSHNSQLTAAVLFSAADDSVATNVADLDTDDSGSGSSSVTASIALDQESVQAYTENLTRENDGNELLTVTANAFIAFYGDDGHMLSLEAWEIDLSNLDLLLVDRLMQMPDGTLEIKTMVLSEVLTPIMTAQEL